MAPIEISAGKVHIYQSSPNGFWVNSYVIETQEGLIVIDTQFILSEARQLSNLVAQLQKPLLAIFITHPHPDHFNGTAELISTAGNIDVVSTAPTLAGIRAIEAGKRDYWTPVYKDDYPAYTVFPNKVLESGQTFFSGGLEFSVEDIGEGETSNSSLLFLPKENLLFGADLAYHRAHPWLIEGHSASWLEQLADNYEKYKNVRAVLVGHGSPGTPELFRDQQAYIRVFRDLVAAKMGPDATVSQQAKDSIKETMIRTYPEFEFSGLIDMNITGVAAEMALNAG